MPNYTMQQFLDANEFHANGKCHRTVGPRGGVTVKTLVFKRNGANKLWKTRPTHFRIPVRHGLYEWDYVTHDDLADNLIHLLEDCPAS